MYVSMLPQVLNHAHQSGDSLRCGVAGDDDLPRLRQHVLQLAEAFLVRPGQARGLDLLGPVRQGLGSGPQVLDDAVPVPEALVAGLAVGEGAGEAAGTLVAAHPRHPLLADAVARHTVALGRLDAARVTVARCRGKQTGLITDQLQ